MVRNNSDFIDLKALLRQYVSKWHYFVISVFVCCSIAAIYILATQPKYAVQANMLISQDNSDPMKANPLDALFGSDGYVEDEIFIVSSHTVYSDVARDLGINVTYLNHKGLRKILEYPNHALELSTPAGMQDTLRSSIVFKVSVDEGSNKADIVGKYLGDKVLDLNDVELPGTIDTPLGPITFAKTQYFPVDEDITYTIILSGYGVAAEDLSEEIHAEIASKKSNMIALSMKTANSDYGEDVLNKIIEKYNERGILQKNNQGELTEQFLNTRISLLATELDKAETELLDYKERNGILNVESQIEYEGEKRSLLEESILAAETELHVMRLSLDFINEAGNEYAQVPITVADPTLQSAVSNLNGLNISRMELRESAHGDNDALVRLERRIDIARNNLVGMFNSAIKRQAKTVDELNSKINSSNGMLAQLPRVERDLRSLYRQQTVKHQLYLYLLQRREENSVLLANAVPKGQIVDQAFTLSEPLGMGKKVILVLAFIFGLFIPPVILYIRRVFHNRFETRHEVERITDVPILGEMCIDRSNEKIVVASDATTATAELFRLMRSNLMFVLNGASDKVVLLTSTTSGEGKSFISINLAASLALLNKKVLLVGMDIRNPRLAEYLDIHPRFGLTQYLSSASVTVDQMIAKVDGVEGLDVIVAGPVPPNPAELLLSDKVDSLFAELRNEYDYIIVDTAPIGLVSDTFTLNRIADAAIYVCRANYTSVNDLVLVNDIFEQQRLKKLSLVINGSAAHKTYGYGAKKAHSK